MFTAWPVLKISFLWGGADLQKNSVAHASRMDQNIKILHFRIYFKFDLRLEYNIDRHILLIPLCLHLITSDHDKVTAIVTKTDSTQSSVLGLGIFRMDYSQSFRLKI